MPSSRDHERSAVLSSYALAPLATKIAQILAGSAVGLAVKAYMVIHADDDAHREDIAALSPAGLAWPEITAGLLQDAVRFVLELAPLCAACLAHDGSLPAEAPAGATIEA
jgi:hypothetical protein